MFYEKISFSVLRQRSHPIENVSLVWIEFLLGAFFYSNLCGPSSPRIRSRDSIAAALGSMVSFACRVIKTRHILETIDDISI